MKTVFLPLPQHIGSYFLQATVYASVTIFQNTIAVAVIRASGKHRTIEQFFEEPITLTDDNDQSDNLRMVIARIATRIPTNARIRLVIPNNHILCKELIVPTMSLEKIKLIMPFELESALPFARSDAFIDSIIAQNIVATKETHVITTTIKRDLLAYYKSIVAPLGREIDMVTTEVIALYALLNDLVQRNIESPTYLLAITEDSTCIVFGTTHAWKYVRIIPLGTHSLREQGQLEHLTHMIAQTVHAHSMRMQVQQQIHFMICGAGADHPEICASLTHAMQSSCELLGATQLLHSGTITSNITLTNNCTLPVVAALPLPTVEDFNLDRDSYEEVTRKGIAHDIMTMIILCSAIVGVYLTTRIIAMQHIYRTLQTTEQSALELLRKQSSFATINKGKPLSVANREAENILRREREIWNSLAGAQRTAVLAVLAELSNSINRQDLGLTLRLLSISMNGNKVTLEGSVKDYPALTKLEQALQKSPFFSRVPNLQDTRFNTSFLFDVRPGSTL